MLERTPLILAIIGMTLAGCSRSGPPYSPEKALRTFRLPEGFRIELAATEPEVIDPIAMAFDERGRLFVVEMRDYPLSSEPLGKIKLLEDRDGDGRFEHSTVFVDGLHFPHGILPWKGGILVTCAPDILYFADTDGDGKADIRKVILTGFARVNPQLRVNAPTYGLDNWIYAAYPRFGAGRRFPQFSDFGQPIRFPDHPEIPPVDIFSTGMDLRFKPDQMKLEAVSGNSEFGLAFDERGHRFPSWNDKHVQHVVIENRYLARNPYLAVGSTVQLASDHGDSAEVYPITENPILRQIRNPTVMSQLGHFTSACGQSIYTGSSFGKEYSGAYFICEPVHNLVHCDRLSPRGATFRASRMIEKGEFLASRDPWFMPVFTATGPDGALYVVDFYRKIVEHPEWIREDLVNAQALFYSGNDRGRIYRITAANGRRRPAPKLHQATSAELIGHLSDANGWWRITSQRLLVERADRSAIPELHRMAREGASAEGRMHALWTLEGLNALDSGLVLRGLDDPSPAVREQAVRLAENFLPDARLAAKLRGMTGDGDSHVLFQLACTLGQLPPAESFRPLQELAAKHLDDNWFQIAVLTAAVENAGQWFRAAISESKFLQRPAEARSAFLKRITGIVGARQKDAEIAQIIAAVSRASGEDAAWWQAAGLHGLAEGLKRGSAGRTKLSSHAQQELLQLVEANAESLRGAALDVAAAIHLADSRQLKAMIRRAGDTLALPATPVAARVHAASVLGLDASRSTLPLLERLLTPKQPEEVQLAAARALLNISGPRSTAVLLKQWSSQTPVVRDVVLAGFFRETERLAALLDALETGAVQPATLSRPTRQRLTRVRDDKIRKRATALFKDDSSDRALVLVKYRRAAGKTGNAGRGNEVFRQHCSNCHKIGDTGVQVGPDLLTVINQSKEELLANILDPNSNIAPGYEDYMIQTSDGRMITGVIANQNATSVTLRRSKGEEDSVPRSSIADMRALTVSAMPENVEEGINVEQMADLLEYLKTLSGSKVAVR